MEIDQEIEVTPVSFEPYSKKNIDNGIIMCYMVDDPWAEVYIYNIPKGSSKEILDQESCTVRVKSATKKNGEIYVSGDLIKEIDGDVDEIVLGPEKVWITVRRFLELSRKGCVICTSPILPKNHEKIIWTSNKKPICQHCTIKRN